MSTEIKTQYADLECRILEIKAMAQELNEEGYSTSLILPFFL